MSNQTKLVAHLFWNFHETQKNEQTKVEHEKILDNLWPQGDKSPLYQTAEENEAIEDQMCNVTGSYYF